MSEGFRIGVDENGLGPRLGPMVVTAVLARICDDGFKVASGKPRGALASRLGDSKGLLAHGNVALGEAWARAIALRMRGNGSSPSDPDDLIHTIAADDRAALAGTHLGQRQQGRRDRCGRMDDGGQVRVVLSLIHI